LYQSTVSDADTVILQDTDRDGCLDSVDLWNKHRSAAWTGAGEFLVHNR